ncbi:MAG: VCBS repeat-containing protein [Deltaproteobacteria bacterium]|nr:VCBS repeat-containing protein [Deltaproteobacteria bacterium]
MRTGCGTVLALAVLTAAPAAAQETELVYDDGAGPNTLRDLAADDIEVVRMTPEHPARLLAVRAYVAAGFPCTLRLTVWADNGGNAPDPDRPLWSTEIAVAAAGWVEAAVPDGAVTLDPPGHFYVGHLLGSPACRLGWDDSGSAEARSLARLGGSWYSITDGETPPGSLDALARATVFYFDVRGEFDFADVGAAAGAPSGMGRMAWGDYDGDGDDDLLVDGRRLFRNDGGGSFTDVTAAAAIGDVPANGGVWADYDNDGRLDFYATVHNYLPACETDDDCVWCTVRTAPDGGYECDEYRHDHACDEGRCLPPSGTRSHDVLWHNEGDGTFRDVSEEAGRPYDFFPTEAAAWGDYDADGFVDLYAANYETPVGWTAGRLSVGTPDVLWRNRGDGTFEDATSAAGMNLPGRCGRGVSWADFDFDGDLDLYVANYRLHPNYFWLAAGDGTFTDVGRTNGTAGVRSDGNYGHSIGAVWGDDDNDGDWDLLVANLAHPRFLEFSDKTMLYRSSGAPDFAFADVREASGITYSETHSNPAWGDADNDGDLDLFLTDVYVGYRSFYYRNDGDGTYTDATYPSGIRVDNGWGCAWADYDGDGRLDLAARSLWRNETPDTGHWLQVRLAGTDSNAAAIGAVVTAHAGGRTLLRQVEGGSGTGVQSSMALHFGLGEATTVETATVRWPSGLVEEYRDLEVDRRVEWREGEAATDADADADADGGEDGAQDVVLDAPDGGNVPVTTGGGGCSCRAGGGAGTGAAWPLALLLAPAALVPRRRRSKRQLGAAEAGGPRTSGTPGQSPAPVTGGGGAGMRGMRGATMLFLATLSGCGGAGVDPLADAVTPEPDGGTIPSPASCEPSSGRTYYVSPTGDDSADGAAGTPWRGLARAVSALGPGDTLYLQEGVFAEALTLTVSGTAEAPILVAGDPVGGPAVLDGTGLSLEEDGLVSVVGARHVTLCSLTVRSSPDHGVAVRDDHEGTTPVGVSVVGLQVLDSDDAAIHVEDAEQVVIQGNVTRESVTSGIGVWYSERVAVRDNVVVNARNDDDRGHEEWISIAGVCDFEVSGNELYMDDPDFGGHTGIDAKESSCRGSIHHNHIHDFPGYGGQIYLDAWEAGLDGTGTLSWIDVHSNLLETAGGITVGSEQGGIVEHVRIFNNVVFRPWSSGIALSDTGVGEGGDGPRRDIAIFNNTIYGSRNHGTASIYLLSANASNVVIRNNVVVADPERVVGRITAGSAAVLPALTVDHNVVLGPTECSHDYPGCVEVSTREGNLEADPLLVDGPNGDLHLQAGSPAVDAGAAIPGLVADFDGTSRPQGAGIDVGAFELAR